jgi:hypothetical protein
MPYIRDARVSQAAAGLRPGRRLTMVLAALQHDPKETQPEWPPLSACGNASHGAPAGVSCMSTDLADSGERVPGRPWAMALCRSGLSVEPLYSSMVLKLGALLVT